MQVAVDRRDGSGESSGGGRIRQVLHRYAGRPAPAGSRRHGSRICNVLFGVCLLAFLAIAPAPAQATFPGDNGKIVYVSQSTTGLGGSEIYAMSADGSGKTNLTNAVDTTFGRAPYDTKPEFSSNGNKIVFMRAVGKFDPPEIFVMNADGTGATQLTTNADDDGSPTWSPDGTKIAFRSTRDNADGIWVMNADGTGQIRLTESAGIDENPSFSPDGTKIVFQSTRDHANGDIYVMNVDGSNETRLTANPTIDINPSFSPDGRKIIFNGGGMGATDVESDIFVMNADGSNVTQLTDTPSNERRPVFSPDGKKIAFDGNPEALGDEIYVMSADGTGRTPLTNGTALVLEPNWGPAPNSGPECFDRQDNDADGKIDFSGQSPDPDCSSTADDSEAPPALSINDTTVAEGDSGEVDATFTVTLAEPSTSEVKVNYATADLTAVAPGDYTPASGTLTFVPGDTSETVTVKVAGDTADEANETFAVNLSSPQNAAITDSQGIGTITDDDDPPPPGAAASIDDVTVTEGNGGEVDATFTVSLSVSSTDAVSIDYSSADATANAPGDYTQTGGTLNFVPGDTSETLTVKVKGDTLDEPNETYSLNLSNPQNAAITDSQGIGTITDDDNPPAGDPAASIIDTSVTEGDAGEKDANFTVSLSAASTKQVSVKYTSSDDTALSPGDYTPATGTLIFAPGDTTETAAVKVKGDTLDELDESFHVTLSDPANATLARAAATGTITDDDLPPTISVGDRTVVEGDAGEQDASFVVSLSAPSERTVRVSLTTANDSATAPADYTAATPILTFTAGQTSKLVDVKVKGDTIDEPDERFFANLSNPSNASIANGQGAGKIIDDDAPGATGGGSTGTAPTGTAPTTQLPGLLSPDTTRPLLSVPSLSRTRFRAASSGASTATAIGTRVSYTLSERGSVSFRVERVLQGRRVGGRCVAVTRANRSRRRCTRYPTLRGSFADRGERGANRFTFRGRLAGRALRPGRYRLRALARDAAGNRSTTRRSGFQIVRR